MRVYHEVLTNAKRSRKAGNHRVLTTVDWNKVSWGDMMTDDGRWHLRLPSTISRVFIYHLTIICAVDDTNKKFYLSHGGWFSRSTNEALAGYRQVFEQAGYENMTKIPVWSYER